jgi:hypothetical protein
VSSSVGGKGKLWTEKKYLSMSLGILVLLEPGGAGMTQVFAGCSDPRGRICDCHH